MSPATAHQRNHIFVFLLIGFISFASSDELKLLLNLKASLAESNTTIFHSWRSTDSVCNFTGITCDETGSFVREINLSNQNLRGSIPFDSICQLQSLEKLSLGFNYFHGNVTHELNKCSKLTYLDLGNNFFSGAIPDISSIKGLLYLYVNSSGFSGTFPWKSLENMTELMVLSVGDNTFDKTPFPNEVLKLHKLNWLYMANCSIGGEIPAGIGGLTELVNFEISDNYITGEIPKEISRLNKLWQLELYDNNLTGKLPVGLRNLTKLEFFDVSKNHLEGDLSEVRFLNHLKSLHLFENDFSGDFPLEIGKFKQLVDLSLYQNQLTGRLPQNLGSWSDFNFIDVSENYLTGPIPPDMCKNGKLTMLLMSQNNFSGEIPSSYVACKTLILFRVGNNMLSGVVPDGIWGFPRAEFVDIEMNNLEGGITSDIKNANRLGKIFAAHNRLSGELPPEISKATSLFVIDLSHNQFSGKLPATIGELSQLEMLYLANNTFTGEIPKSLCSCGSLSDLNMASNSFSGEIPTALGWLPSLRSLNLSSNQFSGQIPSSFSYPQISLLDLSHNRLAGAIPDSIEATSASFARNPGLCSQKVKYLRPCPSNSGGKPRSKRKLITWFLILSDLVLVSLACYFYVRNKSRKDDHSRSWNMTSFHALNFTKDEIIDAIKEENIIGRGGSGEVYRVSLDNGVDVAVKHIRNTHSLEFVAEVEMLSSIRHVNIVKLYCSITSEDSSLLVYEYMPNGSLWDLLHSSEVCGIDWNMRYKIAVGIANGLEYLHHGRSSPVIHRDVKSSNILLDADLMPRLADFGLAKVFQTDTTGSSTQVLAGTQGYMAPEYGCMSRGNEKTDVYSFGVVLMELVTGRKPLEAEFGENNDIVRWVRNKSHTDESVLSLVYSNIHQNYTEETVTVLEIAMMCTNSSPDQRPTMRNVVDMLEMFQEAEPGEIVVA